jgi:GNAT superfamily N-acetyltransferase
MRTSVKILQQNLRDDEGIVNFRIAQPEQAGELTALINRAFLVEKFFIDEDRVNLDQVRHYFETGRFLVAEGEAGLAGCVYIEPRGERAYFGMLSVDPARQGTGLGKRIVSALEEHCREIGCRFIDLHIVNIRTELPPFYSRLGYVETGTAPFPSDIETSLPCHQLRLSISLETPFRGTACHDS